MMYPSLAADSLVDVLRLIRTPNVGPITFFQLILRYDSAAAALEALPKLALRGGKKQPVKPYSKSEAEDEIARTQAFGARFVRYGEADYPRLLSNIEDAPPVIVVKGGLERFQRQPILAMVGSRNASANSCQFAQKLAREVAQSGVAVVSGLARGIDAFAHRGSLANGTLAVIAGGIDNVYPPEHTGLYEEIMQTGAVISEQPFGQLPFAGAFPSRNRIIAGMSHGTLVVEASPKSGSLITARLALDYNRELMAVPGSPMDARAKGCNQLIKQGAQVVEESADVVKLLTQAMQPGRVAESAPATFAHAPVHADEVTAAHTVLRACLSVSAIEVDTLIEQTQLPAAVVQAALLEMELAGTARRGVGGRVSLVYHDEQGAA